MVNGPSLQFECATPLVAFYELAQGPNALLKLLQLRQG